MSNELNRRTAPPAPMGEELPALPVFPNGGSATDLVRSVKSLMHKAVSAIPASLATDSPEPLTAIQVAWIVGKFIAPYAERIRQLERELAERKTASIDTEEALAWAAFAENGNVIIWSRRRDVVEPVATKYGRPVVPVIAYIDGRTAGTENKDA